VHVRQAAVEGDAPLLPAYPGAAAMSVVKIIPDAMRGRDPHPGVRRRRVLLPFGVAKQLQRGLVMTVFSIVNEAGVSTGELEIRLRYASGFTGAFIRRIDGRPFDLTDRARFRMLALARDGQDRAWGLHGEVTEVLSTIPYIA
jgi:hypothetical protein